jgi:E3 ubiquitin-protein ligase RNF115/126
MQAAGPQGPLPASDIVIEGLPRFTFDEKSLGVSGGSGGVPADNPPGASPFRDCPVCKDDFTVGDRVMRIPCTYVVPFHVQDALTNLATYSTPTAYSPG